MNTTIHGCRKIENVNFLQKLVNERNYALLDVRSPVLYRDGTILNAPSAPLRNFTVEFIRTRKNTNKIVLIGSKADTSDLEASIKYAISIPNPDTKETNLSYVLYEEMTGESESHRPNKKRGR